MDFQKVKPGSTPTVCFYCGNDLPEDDFEKFHEAVLGYQKKGEPEDAAQKMTLDNIDKVLSKIYYLPCCRSMFMGDPYEYRKLKKLYNYEDMSEQVKF
jgi:DNA-directed RNA polymerase subunit N (RpoN/RPB10)